MPCVSSLLLGLLKGDILYLGYLLLYLPFSSSLFKGVLWHLFHLFYPSYLHEGASSVWHVSFYFPSCGLMKGAFCVGLAFFFLSRVVYLKGDLSFVLFPR